MDVAAIINGMAEMQEPNIWDERGVWLKKAYVRFAGVPTPMQVVIEMDIMFNKQLERLMKQTVKRDMRVVINGGEGIGNQHYGPLPVSLEIMASQGVGSATVPHAGLVYFVIPASVASPSVFDSEIMMNPPSNDQTWFGISKDDKRRLAFRLVFIHMVRTGFVWPGDEPGADIKHISFSNDGGMRIEANSSS